MAPEIVVEIELDPGETVIVEADGEIICQRDAFLCAAFGTTIDVAFTRRLGYRALRRRRIVLGDSQRFGYSISTKLAVCASGSSYFATTSSQHGRQGRTFSPRRTG